MPFSETFHHWVHFIFMPFLYSPCFIKQFLHCFSYFIPFFFAPFYLSFIFLIPYWDCTFISNFHPFVWSTFSFTFPLLPSPFSPVAAPLPPSCCSGSATPDQCLSSCCISREPQGSVKWVCQALHTVTQAMKLKISRRISLTLVPSKSFLIQVILFIKENS